MATFKYYVGGKPVSLSAQPLGDVAGRAVAPRRGSMSAAGPLRAPAARAPGAMIAVHAQAKRLAPLFHEISEGKLQAVTTKTGNALLILTETMVIEGAGRSAIKKLREKFGLEIVREGSDGKTLLRAPEGGPSGVQSVFKAAEQAFKRGDARVAHPNFLRVLSRTRRSAAGNQPLWNHDNTGDPGLPGADVAAPAAWTISRGEAAIKIAVLDEGVDSNHPALRQAIAAEKDFVDGNTHARPDGDDAHGTACAGIIGSRDTGYPGLAPQCSLIGVRIAKGDGNDGWIFDDFDTADAIDWCWRDANADVLSSSWGGGPEVDVITRAIDRARTKGRGNKGCVVVFAAGNENSGVSYPATLGTVLAVGASNQWDERKSPTSKDGENWWGSNYGPELDLVAPGVRIATTDISGARGYSSSNFTKTFNGTSSATPHVAAAAALVLSVAPKLKEDRIRDILCASVDRISSNGQRNNQVGHGRLNLFAAMRLARR